jgi:hypothetical protein
MRPIGAAKPIYRRVRKAYGIPEKRQRNVPLTLGWCVTLSLTTPYEGIFGLSDRLLGARILSLTDSWLLTPDFCSSEILRLGQ